ncbi:MAG: shikimate kinase [Alphaproteobacteria bacterium]|mgnify:CR=1 FL=1|jgi:shikimate kinase|nr:shikimate kinase [Alphaproteobacteria bacterium]MDP6518139.1 shikimate kinase [Alphaproteobacteria bacterium]
MIETPPLNIDRTLVLVGLMGAGKTTIGRRLAQRLKLRFVDADSEIEAAAGCTISDIFATHGEAAFREGERRVIARLIGETPCVLATGGGAFIDPGTRALIAKNAISLWLRADLDVLYKRVIRRSNRPLLAKGRPRQILKDLMAERYPIYGEADIIVDSVDGPHDALVETVIARLAKRFGKAKPLKEGRE